MAVSKHKVHAVGVQSTCPQKNQEDGALGYILLHINIQGLFGNSIVNHSGFYITSLRPQPEINCLCNRRNSLINLLKDVYCDHTLNPTY